MSSKVHPKWKVLKNLFGKIELEKKIGRVSLQTTIIYMSR